MAKHFPLIHELEETSETLEHQIRSILEICNEIPSKQIKRYINNLLTSCYSEEPKIKWSSLWILCAILEKHKPELDLNTLGGVMSLSESLLVNVENEIYRSLGIEIFCSVIRCISKQNTLGREVVGHLNKIYKRLIPNERLYNLQNDKDLYLLYSLLPQLSASPSKRWNKLILYLLEIINTQHNILLKDLEKINGRSEFVSKRNDQLFSKGNLIESKYDLRINSFKIKNPECLIENCTTCIKYMLLNIPSQVSLQIPVLCPVEHLVFLSTRTLNLRVSFLKLKNNKKKMKKLNLQDNINYQTINSIQQSGANLIKILTQSISKNNLMLYLNPLLSSLLRSLNRKLPKEITASPNWRNTLINALSHLISKAGNSVPTWAIVRIGDWLLLQITAFSQNSLLAKNGFKLIKNYLTHCSKYIPIQTWIQIDKELLKIALELKNFGLEKKNIFVHVCKAIVSSLAAPRAVVPPFLGIALDLFKNEEHPIFKKGRKLASLLITPRSIPLSESVNENWSKFSLLDFFATSSNETNGKIIKQNDSDDYDDEESENKKQKKNKNKKKKKKKKKIETESESESESESGGSEEGNVENGKIKSNFNGVNNNEMINTVYDPKQKQAKNTQEKEKEKEIEMKREKEKDVLEKNEMQIEIEKDNENEGNSDHENEDENIDSGLSVVGGFLSNNFTEKNKGTVEKINKLSWMKNQSTEIVTNKPENNDLNIIENESDILKNNDEEVNFETNNTKNFFDSSSDDDEIPDIIDQPPDSDQDSD